MDPEMFAEWELSEFLAETGRLLILISNYYILIYNNFNPIYGEIFLVFRGSKSRASFVSILLCFGWR